MVQSCKVDQDCFGYGDASNNYIYLYDAQLNDSPYTYLATCNTQLLGGICMDMTNRANHPEPTILSPWDRLASKVIDGDTSTCTQFLNTHCYTSGGQSVLGQAVTNDQICDAAVTIDLGANYSLSGITIYGSTLNSGDVVNVLALPAGPNSLDSYVPQSYVPTGSSTTAPEFTSYTWGGNAAGLFSSNKLPQSFAGASWGEPYYCCGGTTGVTCPTSGSSLGRCPPPYMSASMYALPTWQNSTQAFKNGYTFDFIRNTYQGGISVRPAASPSFTRYLTVVVNAGIAGERGSTVLNLCEVEVRGKLYTPDPLLQNY
jgi:hypothetical protein